MPALHFTTKANLACKIASLFVEAVLMKELIHLNIKLSWWGRLEVRVARILGWGMHDEDGRQLWAGDSASKEAGERHCIGVNTGRLHWSIFQGLPGAALPHYNHTHHLVPPVVITQCVGHNAWAVCDQDHSNLLHSRHVLGLRANDDEQKHLWGLMLKIV